MVIATAFAEDTADAAHQQWRTVADQLRAKFPQLAAPMGSADHDVLAFMQFPKAYRLQIHSTNPLERLNAEIRRSADVVGIFPNDPPIVRLVGAMMLEQNDVWLLNRQYRRLEGLQSLSDNPQTRRSGVTRSVPASQPLPAGNYTIPRVTIGD